MTTRLELITMTVDQAEIRVALDQIARLVDVLRRADPAWCECKGEEPVDDEEWDEVLAEAEDYLEECRAEVRPRTWPLLLTWAVEFVERETECLEESYRGPTGVVEDEIDKHVATDVAEARAWLDEARETLK